MTNTIRLLLAGLGLVLFGATAAPAQDWKPLASAQRCPSRWGAADERGAANHMTSETVMKAVRLVKEGKIYELGRVLEPAMPLFGVRKFNLYTLRSSGPTGPNQLRGNEETVTTELGQVGTQFDGLPHIGIADELYNCNKTEAVATRTGFTKLGVEKVGALFTRAVMLDVAAAKGTPMLDVGYEITVADLEAAMKRQNVSIGRGDAVLIRTGWGQLWLKDNARYNSGQPGLGIAAAEWLAKLDPMLVGSDNWGIEVRPNPNKDLAFPVHQVFITTHGIFLLENLDLEGMARDQVSEAAFIVQPLKLRGGTGSTVAPIAVR
jgi:kynurenine formamidase